MGADNGFFSDNADDNSQRTDASTQNQDRRLVVDGGSAGLTGDNSSLDYFTFEDSHDQTKVTDSFNTIVTDGGAFKLVGDMVNTVLGANNAAVQSANNSAAASSAAASQAAAEAARVSNHSIGAMKDLSETSIGGAFDLSKSSMDIMHDSMNDMLGFGDDILDLGKEFISLQKDFGGLVESTQKGVSEAYKTAASISTGQEAIVKVGLVVAGIVALIAVSGMMKKA